MWEFLLRMDTFSSAIRAQPKWGLFRGSNPGPPAPEAGIIPLDQTAVYGQDDGTNGSMTIAERFVKMLPRGLEPRTLRLLAVRSDQLSYKSLVRVLAATKFSGSLQSLERCLRKKV